jgi:hypothetical protein
MADSNVPPSAKISNVPLRINFNVLDVQLVAEDESVLRTLGCQFKSPG